MFENRAIFELLTLTSTQWRAAFGGIYGLDYNAVRMVAKDMGIITDSVFWTKVKAYENIMLEKVKERYGNR
jgi:1-aminocyclopropane-1-carboxylate deaminase/D-cysteine desulfhydrase-like pyridoxal-dependent ACC family enzyme